MQKLNTIYGKFIKYTLLLLIIPPTIFLISFYYTFRAEVISDAYSDIADEISSQQTAITGWLNHHEDLIKFIASSPNFIEQSDSLLTLFEAFLSAHSDFKSIVFFDKHGDVKMSMPTLAAANVADREYFVRARNGLATITSPLISRLSGEYIVIIAQPVYDKINEFGGVIIGAISFKTLCEEFSLAETNNSTRPYLIDTQSKSLLAKMGQNEPPAIIPPLKTADTPESYLNSSGIWVLGISTPINDGKWILAIERPFNSILNRMEAFLLRFFIVSAVTLLTLLPLIKKYISATVEPIETISKLSSTILSDISNAACPYINMKNAPLELITLYHNFCDMAKKMSSYVQELELSTLTDPLTGLANRRSLEHDGCKVIEICRRSRVSCSCLVLDLDHFKHVNDTYGHQAGDAALQAVSAILKKHTRISDICARFGGEEFTILASSTTAESAMYLAEKIRAEIAKTPAYYKPFTFNITVSIGVAELSQENQCISALADGIRAADCAMYTAKKNGRNRSVQWSGEVCHTG